MRWTRKDTSAAPRSIFPSARSTCSRRSWRPDYAASIRFRFGGISGTNGYGGLFEGNADLEGVYGGWDGPFPPWNDEQIHHYETTVFALDVDNLGLPAGFTLEDLEASVEGHVLDTAQIVSTYTLNPSLR